MPNLLNSPDYQRQLDLLSPADCGLVTLIGAGGIGSPTAVTLAKMGFSSFRFFDDDILERHNLPSQFYMPDDLGKPKVKALRDMIRRFSPAAEVETYVEKYEGDLPLSGIVISAVDSMTSRQAIWQAVKGNRNVRFYVEARTGFPVIRMYAFDPSNGELAEWYEQMLYPDAEAVDAPCTARSIMHLGMAVASLICEQIRKHIRHEPTNKEVLFDLQNLQIMLQ